MLTLHTILVNIAYREQHTGKHYSTAEASDWAALKLKLRDELSRVWQRTRTYTQAAQLGILCWSGRVHLHGTDGMFTGDDQNKDG